MIRRKTGASLHELMTATGGKSISVRRCSEASLAYVVRWMLMTLPRCPYCREPFPPSRYRPDQVVLQRARLSAPTTGIRVDGPLGKLDVCRRP
jgi:hypothetical protein